MNEKLNEFVGYHGTCSRWYNSIEEHGLDPEKVKYREDHWLGQGVYLFEEYDRALWWANDQSDKPANAEFYPTIYEAKIVAKEEEILDLDNDAQLDKFYDAILEINKEIEISLSAKYPVFKEKQFRAVYFDYYKEKNNISVIIRTFNKPIASYAKTRCKNDLNKIVSLANNLGLGYVEKQICVSTKRCIENIELVYNGEDEVI